jgi:hypothetical protein
MTSRQIVEPCAKLIREDHYEHEKIIGFLQRTADPYAISFLRQAILLKPRLDYLAYDDYGAYYKKCFRALRAIGTPDALAVIREFATSNETPLREQALYRLSKIESDGK